MFNLFGKKEKVTIVHTKEELKMAIKRRDPYIEVQGELSGKIKWMTNIPAKKVGALIGVLAALPVVGGVVVGAPVMEVTAAIAKVTGKDVATVILASGISISLIIAVLRDYNIEMEKNGAVLRLKKNEEEK